MGVGGRVVGVGRRPGSPSDQKQTPVGLVPSTPRTSWTQAGPSRQPCSLPSPGPSAWLGAQQETRFQATQAHWPHRSQAPSGQVWPPPGRSLGKGLLVDGWGRTEPSFPEVPSPSHLWAWACRACGQAGRDVAVGPCPLEDSFSSIFKASCLWAPDQPLPGPGQGPEGEAEQGREGLDRERGPDQGRGLKQRLGALEKRASERFCWRARPEL